MPILYTRNKTEGTLPASHNSIISDELYFFIMSISLGHICQAISVFGTISNSINIIIFCKQGFSDSINISLLGLSVSDLCCLLCMIWGNICYTPSFVDSGVPMVTDEVQLITGSWPHVVFTRVTGWITVFISIERCTCVLLPLKVKSIFTHSRHTIIIATIYLVTLVCGSLAYVSVGLGWKFYPERNATLIGVVYDLSVYNREIIENASFLINGVVMPVTCFLLVVMCTIFLVVKMHRQAAWRNSSSSSNFQTKMKAGTESTMSIREKKVSKMVVLISAIFIACFIPAVVIFIGRSLEPKFSYDGLYKNLFLVAFSMSFIAEAINSSINIFVYVKMSTKYRETLQGMFRLSCVSKLD